MDFACLKANCDHAKKYMPPADNTKRASEGEGYVRLWHKANVHAGPS